MHPTPGRPTLLPLPPPDIITIIATIISVAEPLHFQAAPAPGLYFENHGSSFSSKLLEIFNFFKFIVNSWALNVDYVNVKYCYIILN